MLGSTGFVDLIVYAWNSQTPHVWHIVAQSLTFGSMMVNVYYILLHILYIYTHVFNVTQTGVDNGSSGGCFFGCLACTYATHME